ncbi:hypothetical protein SPONN_2062 [uncultured Candidatus Thioglobus sp.]|nr:hypothetical protein SPONN_2062 [uncultured Candidatus Thioglobus sp.]
MHTILCLHNGKAISIALDEVKTSFPTTIGGIWAILVLFVSFF